MHLMFISYGLIVGGSERFMLNACKVFEKNGIEPVIFCFEYDKNFEELANGRFKVITHGEYIPYTIFGLFYNLLFAVKCFCLSLMIFLRCRGRFQFKACILSDLMIFLFVKLFFPRTYCIYYCHYPREYIYKGGGFIGLARKISTSIILFINKLSLNYVDKVCVNSEFTKKAFIETYGNKVEPVVVYPGIDTNAYRFDSNELEESKIFEYLKSRTVISSVNRIDSIKNHDLILDVCNIMKNKHERNVLFVIAGALKSTCFKDIKYMDELIERCEKYGLKYKKICKGEYNNDVDLKEDLDVLFLLNAPDIYVKALYHTAEINIYATVNEHFGIGVVEAMLCGCISVGMNSGGPLEIIDDGVNGFLVSADASEMYSLVMNILDMPNGEKQKIIANAKSKVLDKYSINGLAAAFRDDCDIILSENNRKRD